MSTLFSTGGNEEFNNIVVQGSVEERIDKLERLVEVLISKLPELSNNSGDEAYYIQDDVRREQKEIYG